MMKHEFYYTSRDSVTKIHAIEWLPDRDIKGVLQICHGMVEYIDRYDEFAEFMSEHGYYVVGHDHLGHGKSIQTEADLGYFDERKGNQYVIGDIYQLQEKKMKKYDVVALGELLIDFTENGKSNQGNPLFEANPGGAPCNVLAMLTKLGHKTAFTFFY